jgi:hypothetical protein
VKSVYITDPHSGELYWLKDATATEHLAKQVHEPEKMTTDTGLLDKYGRKLFKHEIREPIGFRRSDK